MLKNSIHIVLLFLVLFCCQDSNAADRRQKVLILHSYHQGLEWTDNITSGIQEVFKPFELEFELYYEYLDTKRNAGEAYMESLYHLQQVKLKSNTFSAVIVTDNNALKFIIDHGDELFGEIPIVFCGVNNFHPKLLGNSSNITGVVERTDYAGNLDLITKLHPERTHINIILDRTPTGDAIFNDIHKVLPGYPELKFAFYRDFLFTEVESKIAAFDSQDIIYLLAFNRDRNNNFISYKEGIEMVKSAAAVPIYGSWDFYLGKGIIGGILTRGIDQGRRAGEMALALLHGTQISNIPIDYEGATVPVFDHRELTQFSISSTKQLPENSLVLYKPPTLIEKYSQYIVVITYFSLIVALLLAVRIFIIRRRNHRLQEDKRLLDATIKQQAQELELEKLRSHSVQADKMLSLGGLAAGMAHEINNPLAGMIQSATVMKTRLEDLDIPANVKAANDIGISVEQIKSFMEKRKIFRMINSINASGMRVAETVENMLSFARKSDNTISFIDPVNLMDRILSLAAADYDLKKAYDFKTIKIIKEYESNLPLIPCESSKIQQVFLNILNNGTQAMQGWDNGDNYSPCFIIRLAKDDKWLKIEIEDNGPGMDEATLSKIFDPFFTTKPAGIGTGLGMSVSHFIITQDHHGTIIVVSSPGKGANFIVKLPLTTGENDQIRT